MRGLDADILLTRCPEVIHCPRMQRLGRTPPKNPDHLRTRPHDADKHRENHLFPPHASMRPSLPQFRCECGVEQQHALFRPIFEVCFSFHGDVEVDRSFSKMLRSEGGQVNTGSATLNAKPCA